MIKNYLQVAWRNLLRNKSYVIINTFGLGISLACCITAYILVAYNIEFDSFHKDEKVADVYKVHTHFKEKDGPTTQTITAPIVFGPIAAEDISGIAQFTRFIYGGGYIRYGDNSFSENIAYVDSTFFDMFDYPLKSGSHLAFKDKHSVFISEEYAKKYFGDEDAVGKVLVLNYPNEIEIQAIVGGVLAKTPVNNSFSVNVLMRVEVFMDINKLEINNWGDWRDPSTFVKLVAGSDPAHISKQFDKYIPLRNEVKKDAMVTAYKLEPFKSSFTQDDIRSSYANLRISFVPLLIFISMAGMILLIACFNLTNTSIALTAKRLKEVGVRKAIGAAQGQIVSQFLLETVITISLSLVVGLIMAQFIVPAFTTMWNLPYGLRDLDGVNLFITLIILVFIASLLAGLYPAIFNSRFKPVSLLKGSVKIKGTNGLTRSLVAIQFALSVIVLIAGVIFIQNTHYQEQIKFGYDKEMVITVNIQSENEYEAIRNAISGNAKILNIGVSDHQVGYSNYQFPVKVDTSEYEARLLGVGKNYFETMGFEFIEGNSFNPENSSDLAEAVVVNKAFLKKVNMVDPLDKIVVVHEVKRHIVGVIEDHIDNLFRSKEPEPFVFYPATPDAYKLMLVKVNAADRGEIDKYIGKIWKETFPTKSYESKFQEDIVLEETKRTNANLKQIFLFLTVLGGLLSASGIFSLASLNIARRTKEIGIRKALGATVVNVVALLNREFVIILMIAVVFGSVGGFYLINALLDEIYAHHIVISIIPIIVCAVGVFAMGMLTTSSTTLKAAKANPVDTLRNE
ncbi:MAG TPA: FtsX-like permease family protein [Ohtaekwangia sp.]|nr:FtsX-like permease family protein [Ohtaekwangia sp.]